MRSGPWREEVVRGEVGEDIQQEAGGELQRPTLLDPEADRTSNE